MKLEKQLLILGVVSVIVTTALFFVLEGKSGSGFLSTAFEFALMTGMTFLVIAINYFAMSFFVKRIARLFKTKRS